MASQQRVEVKWNDLRLAARTNGSGYDANEVPAEDIVKQLAAKAAGPDIRPTVIWFYRPDDAETNDKLDANIFTNETVGLAFKRFHTWRVNVDAIGRDELAKKYDQTPSFSFFDPAGEPLGTMSGRRVTSLSAFTRVVEQVWAASYSLSLKAYVKEMGGILDRLDRVGRQKAAIEADRERLSKKPNARKLKALEVEEAQLAKERKLIDDDEQKVVAKVVLKEEFQKQKPDETAKSD